MYVSSEAWCLLILELELKATYSYRLTHPCAIIDELIYKHLQPCLSKCL